MPIVDTTNLNAFKVGNDLPSKIRQVATVAVRLSVANSPQIIDLKRQTQGKNFADIQGLYIDNSTNNRTIIISAPTGQNISIPAGYFATMPVFISDNPQLSISSLSAFPLSDTAIGTVNITLCNFPLAAQIWQGQRVASALVPGDGDILYSPNFNMTTSYTSLTFSSGSITAPVIGGGPNWFLNKLWLETAAFFSTVAGNLKVFLIDSAFNREIYQGYVWVEPSPGSNPTPRQRLVIDFGTTYGDGVNGSPSNLNITIAPASALAIGPFTGQMDLTTICGTTNQRGVA